MDLRQLQYFIAVAEELHFTRAASRLNMRQPPLSQAIQRLEEDLGVRLLARGTRRVQLTEAGRSFLESARTILRLVDETKLAMHQFSHGERGSIAIGFTASASFNMSVAGAISGFRAAFPDVEIQLTEGVTAELLPRLRSGTLDLAFIRTSPGEADGLREHHQLHEQMFVALPLNHRLASRSGIPLRALANERFVFHPRKDGRALYDSYIAACQNAGFSPNVIQHAPQMASTINLVAAGIGVTFVTESMTQLRADAVLYKPIEGIAPRAVLNVVSGNNISTTLERFLALFKDRLRKERAAAHHPKP
jgi:DNA-binding transcriptional LysR family regulator